MVSAYENAARGELVPGKLLQLPDNGTPAVVTPFCNEASLNASIHAYKGKGYLTYFAHAVKAAQRTLANDLRAAGVKVPKGAVESHLESLCGICCRDEASCIHVRRDVGTTGAPYEEDTNNNARMVVACDPIQTKLREDCMECFPRVNKVSGRKELVVRVHLFYPHDIPCRSVQDRRGRLVTQKQFVPKSARDVQGYHLLNYFQRCSSAWVPPYESMFPYTPRAEASKGFTLENRCTAITVESVFVRTPKRHKRPLYSEDAEQERVYLSCVRVDAFVTDDDLTKHFPPEAMGKGEMPAFTHDRNVEKYNVMVRLYLLAHDQGWTAMQSRGYQPPLDAYTNLPVLFQSCQTEVIVPKKTSCDSPLLLQQNLSPDVDRYIMRFSLRCVVSEALRKRVVAAAAENPELYVPVVCYLPYGNRIPVFTKKQVSVLARLYPRLSIRKPTSCLEWAKLSRTLYQHGVPLFDILAAVGLPLRDAHGAVIDTDARVPYTTDMADDYFLVIANCPVRDYTCMTNQRWLYKHLLLPDHHPPIGARAFAAWVNYWNTMVQLKCELKKQIELDTVSAHLGLSCPHLRKEKRAACLVSGYVTDANGGLIFPHLGNRRFQDTEHVGSLPPGTHVLYIFSVDQELKFTYVSRPLCFVRELPSK
ncbi:hypothetical protein, unknown function [Leishmania tarentolae]|uniref:Uncharacterized protein n=1 Tax=Leishmania tarentolae TaxID=5689 RepID=A0A640KHW6_LEITA|nr:hypothetical protein, unknown function [Leishmania tarentolae]